jgi:uncharacterized membrane protein HdeD (DUF308 family)
LGLLNPEKMTTDQTAKNVSISRWMYLLNGALLIVLGIWMLKMPKESFNAMARIVGIIVLISGILELGLSIYFKKIIPEWGWSLVAGVVDILLGAFLIANPKTILVILTLIISIWLVVRGVLLIREALEMKKGGGDKWKWILGLGILLMLLAIVIIWHPQIVGLTLMIWMAVSFITLGIFRVILAFKLQGHDSAE